MDRESRRKWLDAHIEQFVRGEDCRAYEFLGAHFEEDGTVFRVWAPNANAVSVVGDFNEWDAGRTPMERIDGGIWSVTVPGLSVYDIYKYAVVGADGTVRLKADPYAFHAETRPGTASKLYDLSGYEWNDAGWLAARTATEPYNRPVNIYEVHLGSWQRCEDGSLCSYTEAARRLIPYVKEMGYTHIELMPLAEHPFDGSWGYQCTGYFAATSRYGTPKDLMSFVDACHKAGVGVIMDWVPAHFPKDAHGLYEFDGGYLYEYSDPRKREQHGWGTRIFDFGRNEVISFLMSSAVFWFDMFHFDGLRVDAVAAMLYLDYDRRDGEWAPNINGGRENLEAVELLRRVNTRVFESFPNAMMIAEESTAWPLVTKPVHEGGLGFNFKWNMGWMNDILSYASTDPLFRRYNHNKLTFSMMYAFSENYVLPLSHDETVHGKRSLLDKMPGEYDVKFAGLRVFYTFAMLHPGKKLLFMGGEFGQFKEWDYKSELDWMLLGYDRHRQLSEFVRELNLLYLAEPAFWENDTGWEGFRWISCDDADRNIVALRRIGKDGHEIMAVLNFAPVKRENYRIGLPENGVYRLILSSDEPRFGGGGEFMQEITAEEQPCDGLDFSADFTVPPMGAVIYSVPVPPKPVASAKSRRAPAVKKPKLPPVGKKSPHGI